VTLAERSKVVDTVWPEPMDLATRLVRCALVAAVEAGDAPLALPEKRRAAIEAEVAKKALPAGAGAPA
jgi:hypothetical protein